MDPPDLLGGSEAVNGASDGVSGAKDLLDDSAELGGVGARSHHSTTQRRAGMKTLSFLPRGCDYRGSPHNGPFVPGRVEDVIHGDVSVVLDVLHLLPVPGGLLQCLDDQGSGRRYNGHLNV